MTRRSTWRLVEQLLLRRAGFPVALLAELACSDNAARADEVAVLRAAAEEQRQHLLRVLFPQEVAAAAQRGDRPALRQLSRWRRAVGHHTSPQAPHPTGWSVELQAGYHTWQALLTCMAAAEEVARPLFEAEILQARQALRRLTQRADVREALFLLAPNLIETIEAHLDAPVKPTISSREQLLDRRLYSFMQRLAIKNETHSFFGPLTYGLVDPDVTTTTLGPSTANGTLHREVFASFWAVTALGQAAAADPSIRRALPVRRIAASTVRDGLAWLPNGQQVTLEAELSALFAAVDDARTVAQLAEVAGVAVMEAEARVRRLEQLGLVRRDLEVRSTTARPLEDLRARLPQVPSAAAWHAQINQFEDYLRRFAAADGAARRELLREAEAMFTTATGQAARRAAGQMYADRTILYEDCLGDLNPVRLPVAEATRIEAALSPVLDLGAAYGMLRHTALRTLAGQVALAWDGPVPFLTFAAALNEQIRSGTLEALEEPVRAWLAQLSSRVAAAAEGSVARLRPADIVDLLPEQSGGRFASPDVMLEAGGDAPPRLVIGEVHPYVFGWGSQGYFAPDQEALQAAFQRDLSPWGGVERMAVVVRRRQHKGLVSETFPGTFIDVTGRSTDKPGRRVAVADLLVVAGPHGPQLHGPRGEVVLYVGEDDHPHLRVFAPPLVEIPPIRLGRHTPRLLLDEVVFQRERWSYPAEALRAIADAPSAFELAVAVAAARRAEGWPRYVFAHSPTEPKPIGIDFEIPFAQELVARLLRLSPVVLVEMLPGPEALWLLRDHLPYTSELRVGLVREP